MVGASFLSSLETKAILRYSNFQVSEAFAPRGVSSVSALRLPWPKFRAALDSGSDLRAPGGSCMTATGRRKAGDAGDCQVQLG